MNATMMSKANVGSGKLSTRGGDACLVKLTNPKTSDHLMTVACTFGENVLTLRADGDTQVEMLAGLTWWLTRYRAGCGILRNGTAKASAKLDLRAGAWIGE